MHKCYFVMTTSDVTNEIFDASLYSNPMTLRYSVDGTKVIIKYDSCENMPYEVLLIADVGPFEPQEMREYLSDNAVSWEVAV